MSNTLLTPTIIAKEALLVLENNLVMANLVHRDYSDEFATVGATVYARKPATFAASAFSTTVAAQNITESSVAVVLDKYYDVSANITSKELTLDIVDFSEQILTPMMRAHAQNVDNLLLALYSNIAGHQAVTASTQVVKDLTGLMAMLDIQKVPPTERRVVLHPMTFSRYASLDAVLHADKRGKPLTIEEYSIGHMLGADWYMDQNVNTHNGNISDPAGDFNGAATAGATAATVHALTDGDIIAAGDVFKVAGSNRGYLIVTGGTVGATTSAQVIITFTPALDSGIDSGAIVTFQKDHVANLAFHKNAFALVSRPLAPYLGGVACSVANYKGISCRVAFQGSINDKSNNMSVDMLFGVKTLDKELAARLCDNEGL